MRSRSVVPALVALSAGLTATAAVRRFVGRRRAPVTGAIARAVSPAVFPAAVPAAPVRDAVGVEAVRHAVREAVRDAVREGVVLPFTRPAAPAPERPSLPARCGESGGRTKAGAPCAARATAGSRCRHHRVAA